MTDDRAFRDGIAIGIRALRAERGWTQRELCRRTDLSPAYLSELESGQKDASVDVLNRLAAAFRIRIDQFLWIALLAMLTGEVPGVQRREAALSMVQGLLELDQVNRDEIEDFMEFKRWMQARERPHPRRRRDRTVVDDTEHPEPDFTEDT